MVLVLDGMIKQVWLWLIAHLYIVIQEENWHHQWNIPWNKPMKINFDLQGMWDLFIQNVHYCNIGITESLIDAESRYKQVRLIQFLHFIFLKKHLQHVSLEFLSLQWGEMIWICFKLCNILPVHAAVMNLPGALHCVMAHTSGFAKLTGLWIPEVFRGAAGSRTNYRLFKGCWLAHRGMRH